MAEPKVTLTVRISPKLYNALKRIAKEKNYSLNTIAMDALKAVVPSESQAA